MEKCKCQCRRGSTNGQLRLAAAKANGSPKDMSFKIAAFTFIRQIKHMYLKFAEADNSRLTQVQLNERLFSVLDKTTVAEEFVTAILAAGGSNVFKESLQK